MANKLTSAQCEFIVRKLAAFEPPRSITIDFCAIFAGTRCTEDDVKRLDPSAGAALSPELHSLFIASRESVLLDPASAPFADQTARLIALSKQAAFYIGNNQLAESRMVLRQIAEEKGVLGAKTRGTGTPSETEYPVTSITRTIVDPKEETKKE